MNFLKNKFNSSLVRNFTFAIVCSVGFSVTVKAANYSEYKTQMDQAVKTKLPQTAEFISGRCYTDREPEIVKSGLLMLVPDGDSGVKMVIPAYSISVDEAFWDEYGDVQQNHVQEFSFLSANQVGEFQGDDFVSLLNYEYYPVGILTMKQSTDGTYWLKMSSLPEMSEKRDYFYCHFYKTVYKSE